MREQDILNLMRDVSKTTMHDMTLASLELKLYEEVAELVGSLPNGVFPVKHNAKCSIKDAVAEECGDILNCLFAICNRFGVDILDLFAMSFYKCSLFSPLTFGVNRFKTGLYSLMNTTPSDDKL